MDNERARKHAEEFEQVWDALESGRTTQPTTQLTPEVIALARRLQALNQHAITDSSFVANLWEELMNQAAFAGSSSIRLDAVTLQGLNGNIQSSPKPRRRASAQPRLRRLPGFARFAAIVLLVASIGLGYRVFDPFGSDPETTISIPAAVAPAATPTTTPLPTYSHAIVGMWFVDIDDTAPGSNTNEVIFEKNGSFVSYEASTGLWIGQWRPITDRTVELVFFIQFPTDTQDLFDPELVPQVVAYSPAHFIVWRVTLTLDESGQTMTSLGGFEDFSSGVSAHKEAPWTMKWTRMIVDPTAVFPTPTP